MIDHLRGRPETPRRAEAGRRVRARWRGRPDLRLLCQRVAAEVAMDADADGLPGWLPRVVAWLPAAGTAALAAVYVVRSRTFYWLLLEDHPVEWAQFALLVYSVLVAAFTAVRLARRGSRVALLLFAVALAAAVLAGEEISWGERVFSLVPPLAVSSNNLQGELTIHNMSIDGVQVDDLSKMVELTLALGAITLALLTRPARGALAGTWLRAVAPPLSTVPPFAFMLGYQVFMIGAGVVAAPALLYQEWAEAGLYLAIAVTVACCWLRAGAAAPARGRHEHPSRGRRRERGPLAVAALLALALTGVFAQLTAQSAVLPGNVPRSLRSLYGSF
ncbi:MAG TPA: hypothetical protein VI248_10150 [Kineosporiaceae bacterium]